MKKFLRLIINITFFGCIVTIALIIATLSLTKKLNEDKIQYDQSISATVIKQQIPILAFSEGIVKKIHVRVGQKVSKNDLLIEIDNPLLESKIKALEAHPDNISAQTEADVAKEQLKNSRVYSPADGVVTDVITTEGSPVQSLTKMLDLYSDDNIELLTNLTQDQYQAIQQLHEIKAYSKRLNQQFVIEPDILKPTEEVDNTNQKQIGLFFTFQDPTAAQSLLNNEDLELQLQSTTTPTAKPVDYIVAFWNGIGSFVKKHEK